MVISELNEVLYWSDIDRLLEKETAWWDLPYEEYKEKKAAFYRETIPTKEELLRRFAFYKEHGQPRWISGRHQKIDELTPAFLEEAFWYASEPNGKERAAKAEEAEASWADHLPFYADCVLSANIPDRTILELTVGAGVGPAAILRRMTNADRYIGVDIDFRCAKNADVLGRHYGVNALGLCCSVWELPFDDGMFSVVCSHFGLDECRENPTILKEAVRVLKPDGKLVLTSRVSTFRRHHEMFERYGVDETQALELLKGVRLYADLKALDALAADCGLTKTAYREFNWKYVVEYRK